MMLDGFGRLIYSIQEVDAVNGHVGDDSFNMPRFLESISNWPDFV